MTPYTYLLKFIHPINKEEKFYYGVKFGKDSDPSEFFVSYFTSSKIVGALLKEHGTEAFEYEIRKTFDDPKKARDWERRVIVRMNMCDKDSWLNIAIGPKYFDWTPELKEILRKANTGKVYSETTKLKLSKALTGRKLSVEHNRRKNESNTGKKRSEATKEKMRLAWDRRKQEKMNVIS